MAGWQYDDMRGADGGLANRLPANRQDTLRWFYRVRVDSDRKRDYAGYTAKAEITKGGATEPPFFALCSVQTKKRAGV